MENQFALITGASGGIGQEIASIMASRGHRLLLVARSEEKLKELAHELNDRFGVAILTFSTDLSVLASRDLLIEYVNEMKLDISILVNNAGFGDSGVFAEADWQKNERMIQLNITALTHLTRVFLPGMIASGKGRILNVASIAGYLPGPLMSVYYATKAFVVSFSAALYTELKGTGVTITTLSPGPVGTNFFNAAGADNARVTRLLKPANAQKVALFGYNSMMKGKRVAIYGLSIKFMLFGLHFIPKTFAGKLVKSLHV